MNKFSTVDVDNFVDNFWNFFVVLRRYNNQTMKKIVRTVWIGALSGLAFLGACCTTRGGISKAERKQLIKERDSIQEILKQREMSAVYGSPTLIQKYGLETLRLRNQLDSINYRLGEDVDLEQSAKQLEMKQKRVTLMERLDQLRNALREREGACVYGSPEIIEEYGRETRRMRQEVEELQKQLDELGKPTSQINKGDVEVLYGTKRP